MFNRQIKVSLVKPEKKQEESIEEITNNTASKVAIAHMLGKDAVSAAVTLMAAYVALDITRKVALQSFRHFVIN